MEIAQIPAQDQSTINTDQPTKTAKPQISSDFETFLRMLTVQMRNQDPLNPIDSTDYAVQLATFSSVEQQVRTNDLLSGIADQIGGGSVQQLAGWIGMEALVRAPVQYAGTPIHIRPQVADGAHAGMLVVRNGSGNVVDRRPLALSENTLTWTGVDAQGAALPPGAYRFEVESYAAGSLFDRKTAQVYSRITEARTEDGLVLLRLSDGTEVDSSLVTGLRAPD